MLGMAHALRGLCAPAGRFRALRVKRQRLRALRVSAVGEGRVAGAILTPVFSSESPSPGRPSLSFGVPFPAPGAMALPPVRTKDTHA